MVPGYLQALVYFFMFIKYMFFYSLHVFQILECDIRHKIIFVDKQATVNFMYDSFFISALISEKFEI